MSSRGNPSPPKCPGYAFDSGAGDFDDEPFLVPRTYELPELPWEHIVDRLEPVTISILRFDARLEASGLSAGWQSRCDMTEAIRALLLDGHLVDVGDLVLHDAGRERPHMTVPPADLSTPIGWIGAPVRLSQVASTVNGIVLSHSKHRIQRACRGPHRPQYEIHPRWKAQTLSTGSLARPHGPYRERSFHPSPDAQRTAGILLLL
jgi:hypothetical protein